MLLMSFVLIEGTKAPPDGPSVGSAEQMVV